MPGLSPAERQKLKGRAHKLEPVVIIGGDGLTASVLAEIDRALKSHELIKVRVNAGRDKREAILGEICAKTGAQPVQHIGKILVIYRPRPAQDASHPKKAAVRRKPARRTKRSFQRA